MNMEKTTERYPIRYYSMITVAKDFISQANGSLAEGTADWKAADKELEKLKNFRKARLLRHSGEQSHAVYISSAGNGRRKALLAVHGNGGRPPHVPFH